MASEGKMVCDARGGERENGPNGREESEKANCEGMEQGSME